ncbi:MAG: hypothetical protein EZS28_038431, partial [Streblomastix strix]
KEMKQIEFEKKDDVRIETCDGYYLVYGYGYDLGKGVGDIHALGASNIISSGRSIDQKVKVVSRGKEESESTRISQTRSTNPFGTQGSGEPSQIFITHRQNGNNIQDTEPDELPAIMPTTIKLY